MSSTSEPDIATNRPEAATPQSNGGQVITIEVKVRLQALAISEADGGYSIIVPALPGCVTQGNTIEEVQANVIEAAEGWLEVAHEQEREERLRGAIGP
jgi:predicted RNase H-like HicB family nuclease